MARIYVSSTFSDLEEYREQVRTALRSMHHDDIAMEYYGATDERPVDRCLRDVEGCELYIGIVAWRYGFIPPGYDRSITELEYRAARMKGIPCLLFLATEETWPFSKVEIEALPRIKAWREEIQREHTLAFFANPDDLKAKVYQAVREWELTTGRVSRKQLTDWDAYRRAVFSKHQWVRTQTIAGGTEAGIARIPLIDVFTPQWVLTGTSEYAVPEEIRKRQSIPSETGPRRALMEELPQETDDESVQAVDAPEPAGGPSLEPILDVLGRERTQVFLGAPGLGKSTILHYALLVLCQEQTVQAALPPSLQTAPIPFLIELRRYVLDKAPDFATYIVQLSKGFYVARVDAEDFASLLDEEGRALVFFDGVDEVFDSSDQIRVLEQIEAFARQHPKARIVVTSRIAGYQSMTLNLARFAHYRLQPFDIQQIARFLTTWYEYYSLEGTERTAPGLIQRIMDSPRLLELAGNPLLLTMMAVIYKKRDLPTERWKLYDLCAEVLLEDWDLKFHHIGPEEYKLREPLRTPQKSDILQRVSMYMLEHGRSGKELNAIGETPLLAILTAYLAEEFNLSKGTATNFARQALEHLQTRTYVLAEIDDRVYGFVHRTFMEFFAACRCRDQFIARKSDYSWLTQEIFGAHWQQAEWREVLLLLIAMLHDAKAPIGEVIEYLWRNCAAPNDTNLIFAARCLGEAGDLQDQAQGQDLLGKVAPAIANYVIRSRKPQAALVDEGLQAFAMLAPRLQRKMPRTVQGALSRLNRAGTVAARMTAWQMDFALRAYEERLDFALAGLRDKEEVVRRGAIAALEREWPGRTRVAQQVAQHLADVVRSDRQVRVRRAALEALQRSWPHEPAILDAIASRADEETAYTYVVRLIEYLARSWPGNPTARDLVLRLAGPKPKARSDYDYASVIRAVAQGLAQGWRDDAQRVLKEWARDHETASGRSGALQALAEGWPDDQDALALLYERGAQDADATVRLAAIEAIQRRWRGNAGVLPWLRERASRDQDAHVRFAIIRTVSSGWANDPQTLPWLRERATKDQDGGVREEVLLMIAGEWADAPETLPWLRERAIHDPEASVRSAAVRAMVPGWHGVRGMLPLQMERIIFAEDDSSRWRDMLYPWASDPWMPHRLGRDVLYDVDEVGRPAPLGRRREADPEILSWLLERAARDSDSTVRETAIRTLVFGWGSNREALSRLRERASLDEDVRIRQSAIAAIAQGWADDPETLPWLRELAKKDADSAIRSMALRAVVMCARGRESIISWVIKQANRDPDAAVRKEVEEYLRMSTSDTGAAV